MNSPLAQGARYFGYAAIGIIVLYAVRLLSELSAAPAERMLTIMTAVLLVSWFAEPLLWNRGLAAQAALPPPSPDRAPDQPKGAVPYEVTEQEWVHGKLLYRGVHTATGVARRIALTLPAMLLVYLPLGWFTRDWPQYDFLRDPRDAVLIVLAFAAALVLAGNFYRAPLAAARMFRARGALWWPAEIAWNSDAIFIKNNEGRFRYPLAECRAWKEDASMILLHSGDNRYWCLPKHALEAAGRLAEFTQLLEQHVRKISPYTVVYR
jgi:hypothetical protein